MGFGRNDRGSGTILVIHAYMEKDRCRILPFETLCQSSIAFTCFYLRCLKSRIFTLYLFHDISSIPFQVIDFEYKHSLCISSENTHEFPFFPTFIVLLCLHHTKIMIYLLETIL